MAKILIVDDSLSTLECLKHMFIQKGHDVTIALNGQEAYRFIDAGGQYDLLLVDLIMPQDDGVMVLKNVKAKRPNLHVTIMSSESREDRRSEIMNNGATDFVHKPIDSNLVDAILAKAGI